MKGKGKSVERKIVPTPIIVIDQSQQLANTVIISKMINNKQNASNKFASGIFAGGFKYRPEDNNESIKKSTLLSNIPKIDKVTVYDQFGIINDSIGKKKYRQEKNRFEQGQSQNQFANQNKQLSSNNPWKKQIKQPMANNFVDEGFYHISKLKDQQQSAIHVKSSLEVINLDNIEAKLQAHRQAIKPIEQQYNLLKGKSRVEIEPKPKFRFNIDVDKEYKQLQPSKVYEFIKDSQQKMDRPKQDILIDEMWEQRKRRDPKLAQYDFKYQQYLLQKQSKKLIGNVVKDSLFTWDKYAKKEDLQRRKVAKGHKSKEKQYGQAVERKVISHLNNQSYSPLKQESQKQQAAEMVANQSVNFEQRIASKDDKFIGKFIIADIDKDKKGIISKDQLSDYLITKEHIIKGYHIDLKWLHTDLDNFETKRKGMLNQNQIIQFLATLNAIHHPQMALKQISKNANKQSQKQISFPLERGSEKNQLYTLYFKQYAGKFQQIFTMLDFNDDRIIKRQEFIENIFIDVDCNKILDKNVIVFNIINKSITFRQILSCILDDYRKQKNPKIKKSKEYITLERFNEYFQIPQSLDLNSIDRSNNQKLKRQTTSDQLQIYDIDEEYLILLKDICSTIPRIYQDYIVANDFVMISLKDPQILAISQQLCRIQSVQTKLPVETIKSTLLRMTKQCDQYATWPTLKSYFSRRGRPLDWDYQLIQKKKQIRQKKVKSGQAYVKNISNLQEKELAKSKNIFQLSGKLKGQVRNNSTQKFTIPKPFNITDEKKKKEISTKFISSEQQQIQEMKRQFKAKPLNKEIFEPKPDLIQGRTSKQLEKSAAYNYQNYQNDRIERVLKKAQMQFDEKQQLQEIKRLSQVKVSKMKIDLTKTLDEVQKQHKKNIEKNKPKPTIPNVGSNLYPENPKEEGKKKIERLKEKLQKTEQASKIKDQMTKDIKEKARQKNKQIKEAANEQKKRQLQQEQNLAKIEQNSFKPKIKPYQTTQQQQEAIKKAKEERDRKNQEGLQTVLAQRQKKRKEILNFVPKEKKLDIEGLEDQQILMKIDEVDLQDLLLDDGDRQNYRKQFNFKGKTRKEIRQRFIGLAGRQRAAMDAQQRRLAEQKVQVKQKKQSKIVQEKIESAKEIRNEVTKNLNVDTNFHRSNALRRYRAIMQGKQAPSQYDKHSRMGQMQKQDS